MSGKTFLTRRSRQAGLTMIELLVALVVMSIVLASAMTLLGLSQRMAQVQIGSAEMQQAQRIAHQEISRAVRMAGRGGLQAGFAAGAGNGLAISTRAVPGPPQPPEFITAYNPTLDPKTTEILPGTDVLTVRGVLAEGIWTVNTEDPAHFTLDDSNPLLVNGQVRIYETALPGTPLGNDLDRLRELATANVPAPLILVSDRSDDLYAVVQFDPANSVLSVEPAIVAFQVTGGSHTTAYSTLNPGGVFPDNLNAVGFVGLVEEYRYYIRAAREIVGDASSRIAPRLAMARFLPATTQFLDSQDIADNILDLQVAFGLDLNGDGIVSEAVAEDERDEDEWLFNHEGDDAFNVDTDPGTNLASAPLSYVRLSTITLTDRPQQGGYRAPPLLRFEDHIYDSPLQAAESPFNLEPEIHYRKLVHQNLVDLRNLQ